MKIHWWPNPVAGDIVWCHFPENKGIKPGPKPRPALIVKVFDDQIPHLIVLVAYCTSQKTEQLRSGEFLIANSEAAAYQLAGLSYSTKFSFHSIVELPYSSEWFKVPPGAPNGQTPKLGVLHPSLMQLVQAAWEAVKPKTKVSPGFPFHCATKPLPGQDRREEVFRPLRPLPPV